MNMRKTFLKPSIALFFFTLICNPVFANSGIYKNLLIGIDPPTGILTGAFHEKRNPPIGPSFSCIFALKGNKNETTINAGFPEDKEFTQGEIRFKEQQGKNAVSLKLATQQPGCQQTTPFNFLHGEVLDLTMSKPWIAVMIVISKKAHFYDAPDIKKKRRGYIVYSDCVGILEVDSNWAKVEYVSENRSLIGWLRLQDLGHL